MAIPPEQLNKLLNQRRARAVKCIAYPNRRAPRRYKAEDVARIACQLVASVAASRTQLREALDRRCRICEDDSRRGLNVNPTAGAVAQAEVERNAATDELTFAQAALQRTSRFLEENGTTIAVAIGVVAGVAVLARFAGAILGLVGPLLLGGAARAAAGAALASSPLVLQRLQQMQAANAGIFQIANQAAANAANFLQRVGAR